MGGRHRRAVGGAKAGRGAVIGSTGAVVLLCGALVYGVGALSRQPVDPDPPERSVAASTSVTPVPAGSPTLAMPAGDSPGANMGRQPAVRATTAGPTAPPRTSAAPPQRSAVARTPRTPRVRRSGDCYVFTRGEVSYVYCPNRTRRPHR